MAHLLEGNAWGSTSAVKTDHFLSVTMCMLPIGPILAENSVYRQLSSQALVVMARLSTGHSVWWLPSLSIQSWVLAALKANKTVWKSACKGALLSIFINSFHDMPVSCLRLPHGQFYWLFPLKYSQSVILVYRTDRKATFYALMERRLDRMVHRNFYCIFYRKKSNNCTSVYLLCEDLVHHLCIQLACGW